MTSCKACPAGTNTLQNGSQSINDCVGKLEETFGDKKEDSIFFIMAVMGCLPFSKSFQKIPLESKWNKTSWVVPAENFREQLKIWKGSPVFFRTESLKREFVFHFFKATVWYQFQASAAVFRQIDLICVNGIRNSGTFWILRTFFQTVDRTACACNR